MIRTFLTTWLTLLLVWQPALLCAQPDQVRRQILQQRGHVGTAAPAPPADTTAPEVSPPAIINAAGDEISIPFNEAVTIDDLTGLSLDEDGGDGPTIDAIVSGSGTSTLVLSLAAPPAEGATVDLDIAAGNTIADLADNGLEAISNVTVTNNYEAPAAGDPDLPTSTPSATRPTGWDGTADYTITSKADWDNNKASFAPGDIVDVDVDATDLEGLTLGASTRGTAANPIIIRSDEYASLPSAGTCVAQSDAQFMPKIYTAGAASQDRALWIQSSADGSTGSAEHIWFIGICVENRNTAGSAGQFVTSLFDIGSEADQTPGVDSITAEADLPVGIVVDQCIVRGSNADANTKVGVRADCVDYAIFDSQVYEIHSQSEDGGICVRTYDGGPGLIENVFLEASSMRIFLGESQPAVIPPHDITIRGPHLSCDLTWKAAGWTSKNGFEIKECNRVLMENFILENVYRDAQDGMAFSIKSGGDGDDVGMKSQNITIRRGEVHDTAGGILVHGQGSSTNVSGPSSDILFEDVLFYDRETSHANSSDTLQITAGGLLNYTLRNVTLDYVTQATTNQGSAPGSGLEIKDCILRLGSFGFKGSGLGEGVATLNDAFSSYDVQFNLITRNSNNYDNETSPTPNGTMDNNLFPADLAAIDYEDTTTDDYRLAVTSPGYQNASDGTSDRGCDVAALNGGVPHATGQTGVWLEGVAK